jgi:hypothetical protein
MLDNAAKDEQAQTKYLKSEQSPRGLSLKTVNNIVDKVSGFLKAAPKIHVVQHISEIPVAVLEDMEKNSMLDDNMGSDGQGFAWEGEVWLISDNLSSNQEAVYVLMHELTHGGLGKFFQANTPNVKLRSIRVRHKSLMDAIYKAHGEEVRQIAKTTHTHLDVSTLAGRRQASEEWLCNQAYGAQPKWYDRLAAIFYDILRAIGLDVKLSDAKSGRCYRMRLGRLANRKHYLNMRDMPGRNQMNSLGNWMISYPGN